MKKHLYRFILNAKYGGRYEFFEIETKKAGYEHLKNIGYTKGDIVEIVKLF